MKKTKEPLFETRKFNDYACAKDVYDKAEKNRIRYTIALGLAALATLMIWIGILMNESSTVAATLGGLGIFLGIGSYIVGGGLMKAIKCGVKVAKFGWFLVPFFPIDLLCGLIGAIFGIMFFLSIPVVFVGMNFLQATKDQKEAEQYLSYFSGAQGA